MTLSPNERRQYDRLFHHTRVQVTTSANDKFTASTLNLSDGGLLLKCQFENMPVLGDVMEIQALDFPDAPLKKVIVRRVSEVDQVAVEFL